MAPVQEVQTFLNLFLKNLPPADPKTLPSLLHKVQTDFDHASHGGIPFAKLSKQLQLVLISYPFYHDGQSLIQKEPALLKMIQRNNLDIAEGFLRKSQAGKRVWRFAAANYLGSHAKLPKETEDDNQSMITVSTDDEEEKHGHHPTSKGVSLKLPKHLNLPKLDIEGVHLDLPNNRILMARRKPGAPRMQVTADLGGTHGISVEDLCVALKVFYDPTIKYKTISFSLEPWDVSNPEGEYMRKEFYPDKHEGRAILAGTQFGEVMYEADYLMKQMSLGIAVEGDGTHFPAKKKPFDYPWELSKEGLQPSHTMGKMSDKPQWSRLWIVVKAINSVKSTKKAIENDSRNPNGMETVIIKNAVMGVEARQMVQGEDGRLSDAKVQDTTDNCYKFAKKLSELYDAAAKIYPSFQKLKQLTKAIALARWLWERKVPVDMELVNAVYEDQKKKHGAYREKVAAIRDDNKQTSSHEEKVPVEPRTVAIRSLEHANKPVDEESIQRVLEYFKKNGQNEFFDTRVVTVSRTRMVFGGVNLKCSFDDNTTENSEKSHEDVKGHAPKAEELKFQTGNNMALFREEVRKYDFVNFPLLKRELCHDCKAELTMKESLFHIEKKHYCAAHHPFTCKGCYNIVNGKYVKLGNNCYHENCLLCCVCGDAMKEKMVEVDDGLIHNTCIDGYKALVSHENDMKAKGKDTDSLASVTTTNSHQPPASTTSHAAHHAPHPAPTTTSKLLAPPPPKPDSLHSPAHSPQPVHKPVYQAPKVEPAKASVRPPSSKSPMPASKALPPISKPAPPPATVKPTTKAAPPVNASRAAGLHKPATPPVQSRGGMRPVPLKK